VSAGSVLDALGIPWPDADTGRAREAAKAWAAIATAAQNTLSRGENAAAALGAHNKGPAVDSFTTYWGTIGGSMIPALVKACTAMSAACSEYADAVDEAKRRLEDIAVEIAATVGAGALATVFTLGLSDEVSAAVATSLSATALGCIEVLGTTIADIVGEMAVGTIFSSLDSVLDADLGGSARTALGEDLPSARVEGAHLLEASAIGALTGGTYRFATGAARTAALASMAGLPDSAGTLLPSLPGLLAQVPDALDTPVGTALVKLASRQASGHAVNAPFGQRTAAPTLPEMLGELLNVRLEAALPTTEEAGQ
jgi:uncharacterized protein YukE